MLMGFASCGGLSTFSSGFTTHGGGDFTIHGGSSFTVLGDGGSTVFGGGGFTVLNGGASTSVTVSSESVCRVISCPSSLWGKHPLILCLQLRICWVLDSPNSPWSAFLV